MHAHAQHRAELVKTIGDALMLRAENPDLLRTPGDTYARYAASVGRFVPRIGRLRSPEPRPAREPDPAPAAAHSDGP